jgi:hypothetical protein
VWDLCILEYNSIHGRATKIFILKIIQKDNIYAEKRSKSAKNGDHNIDSRILTLKLDPMSRRIVSGDESGHLLIWPRPQGDSFDDNEMPANILSMGTTKVAGFVLGLTGLEVAMQKGTIEELDFF